MAGNSVTLGLRVRSEVLAEIEDLAGRSKMAKSATAAKLIEIGLWVVANDYNGSLYSALGDVADLDERRAGQ